MEATPILTMSTVGRLLEEVSWERATSYREGGRGRENVLSAEVMMALDFLPRTHFLGALMSAAEGAEEARTTLISEIEQAELSFLPGDLSLTPNVPGKALIAVQPDALITTDKAFVLVEAKRVRTSSFQPEQLAREYVATMANTGVRTPLIFLLGVKPPVTVKGRGKLSLELAIAPALESILSRINNQQFELEELIRGIPEVFCWISWPEVSELVRAQAESFAATDPSTNASVQRLAASVNSSIAWHA